MSDVLVRAESVGRSFAMGDGTIEVLRSVNLAIARRERLAILGNSGVGKSTLLHILGTLDHPTNGRVLFEGEDLFARPPADLGLSSSHSRSASSASRPRNV